MKDLANDELLQLIVNSHPGLLAYIDKNQTYRMVNKNYSEWFHADVVGLSVKEVFKDFYEERRLLIEKALGGEKVVFENTTPHRTRGSLLTQMTYTPHFRHGEVQGILVEVLDISERVKIHDTLHEARVMAEKEREAIYSLLIQAPVSICLFSGLELKVELVNLKARQSIGGEDITGLNLAEAVMGDVKELLIPKIENVFLTGVPMEISSWPVQIKGDDGKITDHFYDLSYHPWLSSRGEIIGVLHMGVDVTEQTLARQRTERALRSRDDFLSVASHELKTPLTSLKLQSQILFRSLEKGHEAGYSKEKLQKFSLQTNDLVSRLGRLIDDMLDVSRIRTGKLRLEKSHVDLKVLFEEVLSRMELQFEEANVPMPSLNVLGHVEGSWDRMRIEQVIINLLTNALKYGRSKPVSIKIWKKHERAYFSVKDSGYGIAPEDTERIFDRFERAIHPAEVSGLGIGLFITRQLVDAHHGKISVESELDVGSEFKVELPQDG